MAKNFKVNVLAHQLKGKKIAKYGEMVSESELTSNSKDLLEKGFIVEVSEEEKAKEAATLKECQAKAKADAEAKAKADADVSPAAKEAAEKLKAKTSGK